jgi:molybdenum cofactor synthesis domain-containing protein
MTDPWAEATEGELDPASARRRGAGAAGGAGPAPSDPAGAAAGTGAGTGPADGAAAQPGGTAPGGTAPGGAAAGSGGGAAGADSGPALRALAITVSNRAAAGVYPDRSGPVLVGLLAAAGCQADGPVVVPDGEPVVAALRDAVAAGYQVVVTTGGTGLTPGDQTPEMTRKVIDREIPGIAEAIRAAGVAGGIDSAMLSRGLAGLAGPVLIVNLPGSTGGVQDGMRVLTAVLAHAVDQAKGGDHQRPA